jgi:predicted NBD/HSP70 family sugar kinase
VKVEMSVVVPIPTYPPPVTVKRVVVPTPLAEDEAIVNKRLEVARFVLVKRVKRALGVVVPIPTEPLKEEAVVEVEMINDVVKLP